MTSYAHATTDSGGARPIGSKDLSKDSSDESDGEDGSYSYDGVDEGEGDGTGEEFIVPDAGAAASLRLDGAVTRPVETGDVVTNRDSNAVTASTGTSTVSWRDIADHWPASADEARQMALALSLHLLVSAATTIESFVAYRGARSSPRRLHNYPREYCCRAGVARVLYTSA